MCCWRLGRCPCSAGDQAVVESNELYGQDEEYEEYEQGNYDTKVMDQNQLYDDDSDYEA